MRMSDTGLSDCDRDRIADYLAKPAYERSVDDLVPADQDETRDVDPDDDAE